VTNAELKQAFLSDVPVRHNGIEYPCIYEINYRKKGGHVNVTAGLLDRNGNCIVYAPVEKVEVVTDGI